MGLCGFGFGGYKEKIDPKIVLVSLFQGRLSNDRLLNEPCAYSFKYIKEV